MTLLALASAALLAAAAPDQPAVTPAPVPAAAPAPAPPTPATTAPDRPTRQFDAVTTALAKGDVAALSKFLDNTVELALPGLDDIYTREQATAKLKGFFGLHPPTGFSRVHGGTSRGEVGAYVIGSLKSGNASFRVYLYGVGEATPTIQEIRIEEE